MAPKRIKPLKTPVQKRAQETLAAILEAGVHILNKQGWDSFTTRNVADRAGVSYGSFYQYFPNRESLLRSIILSRLERDVSELQSLIVECRINECEKDLLPKLVSLLISWHRDDGGMRMIVYQRIAEVNLGSEVKAAQMGLIKLFGDMIFAINGSRPMTSERLEVLFYAVLGVCHSMGPLSQMASFTEIETSLLHLIRSYLSA